ncbi:MAG: hypothetical protein AABZ83_03365 [candidate division NC10 bacterium]
MAARYVSTSVKRKEDPPLLMGRAHFIGDLRVPGLLAVKFLRSPHAHARLVAIDVRGALALPGVEAIVTGADLAATTRPIRAAMSGSGYQESAWPGLAHGKVRFAGEAVALVASATITFVAVRGGARKLVAGLLAMNTPDVLRRVFPAYVR